MIDFALDSEHQELQEMYRKFAEERVKLLPTRWTRRRSMTWVCFRR